MKKEDRTKHWHEPARANRRTRRSNTPRHKWRNGLPTMTRGMREEQECFEEVIYGQNCRRRQQQVIIGTSRDSEIKAEKEKAWLYLSRMTQETMIKGVRRSLNRKGIKEEVLVEELKTMRPYKAFKLGFTFEHLQLMENPEFWPQGARMTISDQL
jgi:hypothetical protein